MKKIKLLTLAAAAIMATGAWAQTDVTSTYLTNADFSETTAITGTYLYGYGKDGSPYGFQTVDGWTSVVTVGDNSNASYPNSGTAAAVFSYGSETQLKGNSKAAPATNPDGEATGKCFGFFGVWGCGGYYYQNVTLSAGKYTITVPMYNQSGTQANTTYTGFFPTSGTNHTVAVNPTVGQWVNQTVTFTLADDTEGQIRIGYQSTGSGSGSNPMLFIDCVKIEFTAIVVKDVLETAITAAQSVNARLNSADLSTAITTAQAVYTDEDATQDEVNVAAATLNAAVELAVANHINNGGDPTDVLANADLSSLDGWTVASSSQYNDKGNGLIGTYNVRFSAATVDETHLDTEYCLGFEARWSGNFASYSQTTVALPAGVYTLTYDVENVNAATSNLNYADYNFVQVGDTKYYSSATEWMAAKSSWTTHTIRVTLEEAAPITISFGYGTGSNNTPADNTPAIYVSHVKLNYSSFLDGAKAAWDEAVAAAKQAKTDCPNVTGEELTALNEELEKDEPTKIEDYNEATEALEAATNTFTAAVSAYNTIVALNARATAVGLDSYAITSETTAAAINAAIPAFENRILVKEREEDVTAFNQVQIDYPYEISLGDWTTTGAVKNQQDQHWNGDTNAKYNEPDSWGSNSGGTSSWTQDVALPQGSYVLQIAGRHSENSELTVTVKNGDKELALASNFPKQGSGYGIDLDGNANFDMSGSYANTTGWGWEWRLLFFSLEEETTVTITVNYKSTVFGQWASFTSYVIKSQFPKEKIDLLNAIKVAEAVDLTANVGTGVFQKNFEDNGTLVAAIKTARGVYDNADATTEQVVEAISTLNGVKETVVAEFQVAELNAPNEEDVYSLYLTDGLQKTVTFKAGNENAGTYAIGYTEDAGSAYNQAIHFAKIEGNQYKLYIKDDADTKHYICTGSVYSGSDDQIRMTDDIEKALVIEIIATDVEGEYNLLNTAANALIGSNGDVGFFTASTYKAFNINAAQKASVTINTNNAGWGTLILPFAADVPTGLKAYTVATVTPDEDNTPELNLVLANKFEANKPYILEGKVETTLEGYGLAKTKTYTDGLLTGTYADYQTVGKEYVLQNPDGKIGFYQVGTEEGDAKPWVRANHAYLTYTAPTGEENAVKAFFLGENTTAVNTVKVAAENAAVYNLAGQRVNKAQKGIYIVNGQKVVK